MASNTFVSLPADEQQRLVNKLAKLKALAECKTGNVNETATAAATMTRLMMEYQIEIADLQIDETSEEKSVVIEDLNGQVSRRGFPGWHLRLLTTFARTNNCVSYTNSERVYSVWRCESHSRLCLIGAIEDIARSRKLFFYCVQEVEQLCYRWGPSAPVARKNDFRTGAAVGICEKVELEHQAVLAEEKLRSRAKGQDSRALAVFDRKQKAVDEKAEEIGLRFDCKSRSRGVSAQAYDAGYRAGSSLDVSGSARPALK